MVVLINRKGVRAGSVRLCHLPERFTLTRVFAPWGLENNFQTFQRVAGCWVLLPESFIQLLSWPDLPLRCLSVLLAAFGRNSPQYPEYLSNKFYGWLVEKSSIEFSSCRLKCCGPSHQRANSENPLRCCTEQHQ